MKRLIGLITAITTVPLLSVAKDWQGANDTHLVGVGDINNPANKETGLGAVSYEYSIGKFEVTNAQYAKFMNSVGSNTVSVNGADVKLYGGFDTSASYSKFSLIQQNESGNAFTVDAGKDNYAVNFISAFGAAMYCNWLTNGAPEVSTTDILLTGAYNFGQFGATIDVFKEENINLNGTYRLPTADEWHKAAFYNPEDESYFLYAVGSDSISEDMANYKNSAGGMSSVKQYEMFASVYGTVGQNGNAIEWICEIAANGDKLGTTGGGFYSTMYALRSTASIVNLDPDSSVGRANGFRIAYSSVPEPSTYAAIFGALALGFAVCRRRN